MGKSITVLAVIALSLTTTAAQWPGQSRAAAQAGALFVNAVDLDIVPGQIDAYLAAVKKNAAASMQDPGCRQFTVAVSQKDPNHVLLFEVYDNAAALEAHQATDHFKDYAATTKHMVAKRVTTSLSAAAMNVRGL